MQTHLKLATPKKGSKSISDYFSKAKALFVSLHAIGHLLSPQSSIFIFWPVLALNLNLCSHPFPPNKIPYLLSKIFSYILIHEFRPFHKNSLLFGSPLAASSCEFAKPRILLQVHIILLGHMVENLHHGLEFLGLKILLVNERKLLG